MGDKVTDMVADNKIICPTLSWTCKNFLTPKYIRKLLVVVVGAGVIHTISVTWLVIVMFLTFTFLLMLTFVTKPSVLVKLNLEQYPSWLIGSLTIIV